MGLFRRNKDKHLITIIYKDHVEDVEVDYPENGVYKHKDGSAYYLDPSKKRHIYIHGYVNEVDGAHVEVDPRDVHKVAKKFAFEPSFTFINAYENTILQQLLKSVEGTPFDDVILYALTAVVIILAFLVWNMNNNLTELMKYVGIKLLGGLL